MLITTVCAVLSAAGLAVALLTAWRRRFVRAARIAAVALLPVGLAASGLLGVAVDIGTSVADWAAGLVLRPTVWGGFAALGGAVVLYAGARIGARRRGAGDRATDAAPAAAPAAAAGGRAVGDSTSAALTTRTETAPASGSGEDFSDVEVILKKHGI
jgi:hypothetical protein